jgi:hypothetical protein
MSDYRFALGSTVYIWRRSSFGPSIAGAYTVVAHYPSDSSGRLYRIRSVLGMEERMVPEGELATAPRSPSTVPSPRKQRSA